MNNRAQYTAFRCSTQAPRADNNADRHRFFEALAGFRQLLFGGLLSFLDESVKDGDDLTAAVAVAVEGAANARTALGPEFKQTVAHGF
jgi:hypothetical protein